MRRKLVLIAAFTFLFCLEIDFCEAHPKFKNGFYFGLLSGKYSGVPVSYNRVDDSHRDFPYPYLKYPVTSSSPTRAFIIGYSLSLPSAGMNSTKQYKDWGFLDIEFDYSSGRFTDWRVDNRKISYFMFAMNLGFAPFPKIPIAAYWPIGGGWYKQSEYYEEPLFPPRSFENPDPSEYFYAYEYLDKVYYPVFTGIGLKFALINHFILRTDYRFYSSGGGYNPSSGQNVVVVDVGKHQKSKNFGNRYTFGLEFHF